MNTSVLSSRTKIGGLALSITLVFAGCRTTQKPGTIRIRKPDVAAADARQKSDPAHAFDLAFVVGNDRAYAKERLTKALTINRADPQLLVRAAFLAEAELNPSAWRKALLNVLRAAPRSPEAAVALTLLIERFVFHAPHRAEIKAAVEASGLLSEPAPAGLVAMASLLISRINAMDRNVDAKVKSIARGGWLTAARSVGPLGPKMYASLETPHRFETEGPLAAVRYRGKDLPVRKVQPWRAAIAPAAGDVGGLYVSEVYFELSEAAAAGPVVMQVLLQSSARARIDGEVVFERNTITGAQPGFQEVRMQLSPGWHRLSWSMLTRAAESVSFSILGENGEVVVMRQNDGTEPPSSVGRGPTNIEIGRGIGFDAFDPLLETDDRDIAGRLYATRMAISSWRRGTERAREMLYLAAIAAPDSAAILAMDARRRSVEGMPQGFGLALLEKAMKLDPGHPQNLMMVARAKQRHDEDRALELAGQVAELAPETSQADMLRFQVMRGRGWNAEAEHYLRAAIERSAGNNKGKTSATGSILKEASRFFREVSRTPEAEQFARAALALEEPGPGAYKALLAARRGDTDGAVAGYREAAQTTARPAHFLSKIAEIELGRGQSQACLTELRKALAFDPMHRESLRLLATALTLTGKEADLTEAKGVLAKLRSYDVPDAELETFTAQLEGRKPALPSPGSWLAKALELDTIGLVKAAPDPRWSRSAQVHLLDRHVDYVRPDGHSLALTHLVTRLNNKEAADRAGEFQLPEGSIPLRMRTIKANGDVIPVDRHEGKQDLSFSALAPQDAVERQWVEIHRPQTGWGGFLRRFYFRDAAPNLRSELIVVVPKDTVVWSQSYNGAPQPTKHVEGELAYHVWRMTDVPGVVREPNSVSGEEFVPFVAVAVGMDEKLARRANVAPYDGFTRGSFEVSDRTRRIVPTEAPSAAKAEALFRWVIDNIDDGPPHDPTVTLATGRGDRTGLLAAMLRAAGVEAQVALTRGFGATKLDVPYPDPGFFRGALIRVQTETGMIWISPAGKAPWFGLAPPAMRGGQYVLLSERPPKVYDFPPGEVAKWDLASKISLDVDAMGNAKGALVLTLPGQYGQTLRSALGPLREEDKTRAFTGWLSGFLPGSSIESIVVRGEDDILANLELEIRVNVKAFMQKHKDGLVANRFFGQPLASSLVGLPPPSAYLRVGRRQTPLFVRESSEQLQVDLQFVPGTTPTKDVPKNWKKTAPWGEFSQTFAWTGAAARLTISHRIESRRVAPSDFPAFADVIQEVSLRARNRLAVQRKLMAQQ